MKAVWKRSEGRAGRDCGARNGGAGREGRAGPNFGLSSEPRAGWLPCAAAGPDWLGADSSWNEVAAPPGSPTNGLFSTSAAGSPSDLKGVPDPLMRRRAGSTGLPLSRTRGCRAVSGPGPGRTWYR